VKFYSPKKNITQVKGIKTKKKGNLQSFKEKRLLPFILKINWFSVDAFEYLEIYPLSLSLSLSLSHDFPKKLKPSQVNQRKEDLQPQFPMTTKFFFSHK